MTRVRKSLLYSLGETLVGLPLQLAGTVLLARLLTPEQTGVFAVAAVFASFASTFRDFGVAEYLIQAPQVDATRLRAALSVNIITSWSMAALLFGIAPWVAEFYRHPGVADVMRVQCLSFLLIPFGAVTMAMFRRELNLRPSFISSLMANVVTFAVGTGCALAGLSYMSLAWSSLAGTVVSVGTAMWFRPRDFPRWPGLQGMAEVFHFGKFASGVYLFGQLGRGAPEMIIGRAQGMADVAMFSRGGGLVELYHRLLLRSIMPVCQPYFAQGARQSGAVNEGYLRSMAYLTVVGWPALVFLAAAAFPAVRILYGTQWMAAVDLAKLLCLAAAVELVHVLCKEALLAVGEARRANTLQIITQGLRVLGLLAAVPFGIVGASWGLVAAAVAGLLVSQWSMRQAIGLHWRSVLGACRTSAAITAGTALPLLLLSWLVPPSEANYLRWLLAAVPLTVAAWVLGVRASGHPVWAELQRMAAPLLARLPFKRAGKGAA